MLQPWRSSCIALEWTSMNWRAWRKRTCSTHCVRRRMTFKCSEEQCFFQMLGLAPSQHSLTFAPHGRQSGREGQDMLRGKHPAWRRLCSLSQHCGGEVTLHAISCHFFWTRPHGSPCPPLCVCVPRPWLPPPNCWRDELCAAHSCCPQLPIGLKFIIQFVAGWPPPVGRAGPHGSSLHHCTSSAGHQPGTWGQRKFLWRQHTAQVRELARLGDKTTRDPYPLSTQEHAEELEALTASSNEERGH